MTLFLRYLRSRVQGANSAGLRFCERHWVQRLLKLLRTRHRPSRRLPFPPAHLTTRHNDPSAEIETWSGRWSGDGLGIPAIA